MYKLPIAGAVLLSLGWWLVGGGLPELPSERLPASEELVLDLPEGEALALEPALASAHWTLVEFGADWCPACVQLEPLIEARVRELGTLRLRRIDVPTWESPVALKHGIRRLPTLQLYDGRELVSDDTQEILEHLFEVP